MRTLPLSSRLCGHPWLSSVRIFFGVQFSSLASSDTVRHIFGSLGKRIMRVRGSCANSTVCHHATSAKASLCCTLLRIQPPARGSHHPSEPRNIAPIGSQNSGQGTRYLVLSPVPGTLDSDLGFLLTCLQACLDRTAEGNPPRGRLPAAAVGVGRGW